jgi:hypothetical protein
MTDKVILSNGSVLAAKYGAAGAKKVRKAVQALIAADGRRGLTTIYIELDDTSTMNKYGNAVVTNSASAQQNKVAVDAVYKTLAPDYIVLLGAVDVIPHQSMANPLYKAADPDDDPDRVVPSDLPYACEAGYATTIESFTGPTRVVGRLPDLTGGTDPANLIDALNTAAAVAPRPREDYEPYFAISADVWKQSTGLSLNAVFGGDADEQVCPPSVPPWSAALLARRSHFINCHGASRSPEFFGQHGKKYPVSYEASQLNGKLSEGVVAAMECCYGAELYDVTKVKNQQPGIGNTYLANKAYGYLGSTTVAYGPDDSNDWADMLCQYFLEGVLEGASLGRALLEARQKYIQDAPTPLGPVDLKTLAQFLLLGDPSIQPVEPAPSQPLAKSLTTAMAKSKMFSLTVSGRGSRIERRKDLMTNGLALARTWPTVRTKAAAPASGDMRAQLQKLAKEMGLKEPSMFTFKAPKTRASAARTGDQPKALIARQADVTAVHVMLDTEQAGENRVNRITAVVVREAAGRVVSVRQGFAK